jgi:hypothetical protein
MSKENVYQKLSKIQKEFKSSKGRVNPFAKYKFRSAEDILEALKPFNEKYGVLFTVNEKLINIDSFPIIESTAKIIEVSDSSEISATSIVGVDLHQKGMQVPQQFGTASSYAKKYALGNLLLIDDTQDSDATNTHGRSKPKLEGEALSKAKEYISSGKGSVSDIKIKYNISTELEKELLKIQK